MINEPTFLHSHSFFFVFSCCCLLFLFVLTRSYIDVRVAHLFQRISFVYSRSPFSIEFMIEDHLFDRIQNIV